ncbi:MAG: PAS domain-containing sensor histidine kinase [Micavibrio aeruginosavorus]|uniref:histidine kinase n=1 Tax=Micavibrio aeruginosavorus TaxID=349221 RepID=A0A7T5R4I8_9BACT|nr:MAG: PAS domain-containing sensor histidine kinase [Micavibrio aeruginosavorus]
MVLIILALGSGILTYMALSEVPPFGNDAGMVVWLLNLDLVLLIMLIAVIARRIITVWAGHRRGIAGSRLHMRLAFIFSLVAAVPAVIMTVFSAVFLYYGVQTWFSDRIRTAVSESEAVAEAYLKEHHQVIRADILAMANDLDRQSAILATNEEAFGRMMKTQLFMRNLSEAMVIDGSGRVIAESGFTFTLSFETVPQTTFEKADAGDVVLITDDTGDRIRALVKLNNFIDSYLFVGRMVDSTVLRHLSDTKQAVAAYKQLERQYSDLQVKITMIFVVVALVLLLSAMWGGLIFARHLVAPIAALTSAADRIRAGDLTARVENFDRGDEFDLLARAFNRMTTQLQEQRTELITANRQMDQRRRFTETVLAGVSSGVMGVDEAGKVTLANFSAGEIFELRPEDLAGRNVQDVLPEIYELLAQARTKPGKITQGEVPYRRRDETQRTLLVRIAIEMIGEENIGAVLTFDDITELQSAQRKAAWSDVARRIAHEIKNPLTPIQLSAERLKRKYLKQITEEPEIFSQCTDTIIHHVEDIGRMVNEFSAFARMPLPIFKSETIMRDIREIVTLRQQAHPELSITFENQSGYDSNIALEVDGQQIRQAFTNIIQNAIDSIQARRDQEGIEGHILVLLSRRVENQELVISVIDNGLGFPKDQEIGRLVEPYVTTRETGTGLGLAIVKKVMDDHKGSLILGQTDGIKSMPGWHDFGGACVSLILPVARVDIMKEVA